jgi:FkbH-like protein
VRRAREVLARPMSGIRKVGRVIRARWALRACDHVGKWTRAMWGSPIVENNGFIDVGARTRFLCEFGPVELRTAEGGHLLIGERTGINYGTSIHAVESVTIGRNVDMGPHCLISDADTGSVDHPDRATVEPVVIGDDVWLASRVTVLPGSNIGHGAIITAGSVVDGVIPPRVVAGGIPARMLRALDESAEPAVDAEPVAAPVPAPILTSTPDRPKPPIAGRGLLIADFTIDPLARALERPTAAVRLHAEIAPYDTVVPTLLAPPSADADFAVVWSRPEAILPSFARLLAAEDVDKEELLGDVDRFADLVERGSTDFGCVIVPTWTVPPWLAGGALTESRPGGVAWALNLANQRLMDATSRLTKVFVLDTQRWLSAAASDAYNERLWFMGKVPFDERVFEHAADDIAAAVTAMRGGARKLVIVDLDNTLWGGVVGDDGWETLRLGGHDSDGEAYVEFQRALQQLMRRGVLLAIVSKNDEAVALEAINRHDGMVLTLDDFAGWRINWDDKAANIVSLVAELNLGLQSVVFIDDNDHERARVAEALPEVLVPDWPDDPTSYPRALRALTCFDSPVKSDEDANRTQLYVTERRRTELLSSVGSLDDWIRELDIVVRADPLGPGNVPRASQLLNKTNQMNLTTRRLTEAEFTDWAAHAGHATWCVTVSDRLGDAGLTGLISIAVDGDQATLVDYVLSCRVMGRRVEPTMVHLACGLARELGARRLVATFVPTAKNDPCRRFFDDSGMTPTQDNRYEWDLQADYPPPRDLVIQSPITVTPQA